VAQVVRYNEACAYSWASVRGPEAEREEWGAEAVRALEKLREDGYFKSPRTLSHLGADPDLNPIRNRADYRAFRAKLPAEVAPPPRPVKGH
jgi:hypothetical protein